MEKNENISRQELETTVHAEKLTLLYQQSALAVVGNTLNALLIVYILWPAQDSSILLSWLAILMSTAVARGYLFLRYRQHTLQKLDIIGWEKPHFFALIASALIWGIGGIIIMPADSLVYQMLVFSFLIGMSGGAISFYTLHRLLTLMTVACLLVPVTVWFLFTGSHVLVGAAIGSIIFLVSAARSVKSLSSSLHQTFVLTHDLKTARNIAENLARKDALTGLDNRRSFYEQSEALKNHCQRHENTFTCILIDLDHFKNINDTHGHSTGDITLSGIAEILEQRTRESDVCARIGGEEFAILLPSSTLAEARSIADDLRQSIESKVFSVNEISFSITASFGVAQYFTSIDSLISRADDALYAAKAAGRNIIKCDERTGPLMSVNSAVGN